MRPLLAIAIDGEIHKLSEMVEKLADEFQLTPEERAQLLPSGCQPNFENRVGWSKFHLVKAGLLEAPVRGHFKITQRGREVLRDIVSPWQVSYLTQTQITYF